MRPAQSLVARVAWGATLALALGGACVALVAGLIADQLARDREDAHLRDAAGVLALELLETDADPIWIAEDETRELANTAITIAIYEGDRRIGGDPAIPHAAPGACIEATGRRACAIGAGRWVAVAGRDTAPIREHREAMMIGALVAVALTTIAGALASRALARALVAPLSRLRDAVERVPELDPSAANLGPDEAVSEVDALRASLRHVLGRLGATLAQSRRFASDAAHELRTPLTAILGELELALERAPADDREEILRARRVAQRVSVLVDRLLILARAEGVLESEEDIDPTEIVEDALEGITPLARARVTIAGSAPLVRGDRALLVAMAANAIENALKFSEGGVRIELGARDRSSVLAIVDRGRGIAPAEREKVFTAFYRAREVRGAVPGHGIGLALIAHVVALHGGSARFVEVATGARLELALPSAA